jgi:hypothetical protein
MSTARTSSTRVRFKLNAGTNRNSYSGGRKVVSPLMSDIDAITVSAIVD